MANTKDAADRCKADSIFTASSSRILKILAPFCSPLQEGEMHYVVKRVLLMHVRSCRTACTDAGEVRVSPQSKSL
jgi:hypothetical protein